MQEAHSVTTSSGTPVRHPSDGRETVWNPKLLDRLSESLRLSRYRPLSHLTGYLTILPAVAVHCSDDAYDVRTIQELIAHEDEEKGDVGSNATYGKRVLFLMWEMEIG